jgi:hypothetical protein
VLGRSSAVNGQTCDVDPKPLDANEHRLDCHRATLFDVHTATALLARGAATSFGRGAGRFFHERNRRPEESVRTSYRDVDESSHVWQRYSSLVAPTASVRFVRRKIRVQLAQFAFTSTPASR